MSKSIFMPFLRIDIGPQMRAVENSESTIEADIVNLRTNTRIGKAKNVEMKIDPENNTVTIVTTIDLLGAEQ